MKSLSETKQYKEHASRSRQLVHSDALTGLPNRTLLEERLHKAIDQSKRWGQLLAVVRLRLEGLEALRDRHGSRGGRLGLLRCRRKGEEEGDDDEQTSHPTPYAGGQHEP